MSFIKNYPTPIGGLALGTAGIAVFWSNVANSAKLSHGILVSASILVIALLLPLILKFALHKNELWDNLKHPTVGSVVPTSAMTLMLLSQTVGLFHPLIAEKMWMIAVMLHITFFCIFAFHRARAFDLNQFVPSWFIPPIGMVVACLTLPSARYLGFANNILMFGFLAYSVLLPLMIYRLLKGDQIEDLRKPTLAVLAAPASLTLSAYLTLTDTPNTTLVTLLFTLALFMTSAVYLLLTRLLRLSFSPAFSAFTFPLVISATATLKISLWSSAHEGFTQYTHTFYITALVEGVIASAIIIYVLKAYLNFFWKTRQHKTL